MKNKKQNFFLIFDIENWLWQFDFGTFWQTVIQCFHKIKWFPLRMLIFFKKNAFYYQPSLKFHNRTDTVDHPFYFYCFSNQMGQFWLKFNYLIIWHFNYKVIIFQSHFFVLFVSVFSTNCQFWWIQNNLITQGEIQGL